MLLSHDKQYHSYKQWWKKEATKTREGYSDCQDTFVSRKLHSCKNDIPIEVQ